MEKRCDLSHAVGHAETCPQAGCAFWSGDRCAIAGLSVELECNRALAEHLLELRSELTRHSPISTFRLFHPPGLA